jgi:hypothetical protein
MTEANLLKLLKDRGTWADTRDMLLALGLANDSWNSTVAHLHDLSRANAIQRRRTPKGVWQFAAPGVADAVTPDVNKPESDLPQQYLSPPVWDETCGDYPNTWTKKGPYSDTAPRVGFRCGWSVNWVLDNPFPPPELEHMEMGALLLEAADAAAQGVIPASLVENVRAGDKRHSRKMLEDALRAARCGYAEGVGLWTLTHPKAAFISRVTTIRGWDIPLPEALRYAKLRAGGWAVVDHENRIVYQLCGPAAVRGISRAEEREATVACREAMANQWRRR